MSTTTEKRLKIAFVNQPLGTMSLPVKAGSISIWTYEITRRLARSCEVIVYARRGGSQQAVERYEGVQYRRVSVPSEKISQLGRRLSRKIRSMGLSQMAGHFSAADEVLRRFLQHSVPKRNAQRPYFASGWYYLGYALQVANRLRAERCDVVHIHNFSQFIPMVRAFNPDVKILFHTHAEWLSQLDRALIERRLRHADLVVGCSEYLTEKIRSRFPQFASRCQTVYNGVDIEHFARQNNHQAAEYRKPKRLLFVGRISPEKGLHILLDAFRIVVQHYPQVELQIIGPPWRAPLEFLDPLSEDHKVTELVALYDGSYPGYLQQLAHSLNIAGQVTFTGFIPQRSDLIKHFQQADIFVFPSVWNETFGMPLVEAMACQVPVVATGVGGMPEVINDGKSGLLVNPGDAPALADAILRLLTHAELRQSMGKAGLRRVLNLFSWERIAEKLLCQYKTLCAGQKAG
jgi:glycosyltransferase involved in cell wall biosynthesis